MRCDRTIPHCSKCKTRDIECLGYGQLFLWTGAVASRGKLAGRTSSADLYQPPSKRKKIEHTQPAEPAEAPEPVEPIIEEVEPVIEELEADSSHTNDDVELVSSGDTQVVCVTPSVHSEVSTPWALVDPLYQDLTYSHRQYLAYCKDPCLIIGSGYLIRLIA